MEDRTYDSNLILNKVFNDGVFTVRQDSNNILNAVYSEDDNAIKVNVTNLPEPTDTLWENYNETAAYATYTETPKGCSTSVTITADTIGADGNKIEIKFNGAETINDGITGWNSANPTNTCSLTTGDGTQIPYDEATLVLTGGANEGSSTGVQTVGTDCIAIGNMSHAEGYHTTASGYASHAEGYYTTASGFCSHAEGNSTTASRDCSHAEGNSTTASGYASHAEGAFTTASGYASHAEGAATTASGRCSHAEGDSTTASGDYSHAEGYDTTASGYASHAEGYHTTASGYDSHAEGYDTTASGYASHAEGYHTTASGYDSHAEGYDTTASGYASHAEGAATTASGGCSHAEGDHTTAHDYAEHTGGRFNIIGNGDSDKWSQTDNLFTLGNGIDKDNRSNAFQVKKNGKVIAASSVKVGDDSTAASIKNIGAIRYSSTANSSNCEMVMQTGASTYAWVVIKTNTW